MRGSNWLVPLILIGGPLALLFGLVALLACGGNGDLGLRQGSSQIRIYLTDAPSDQLQSARVTLSGAYVIAADSEDEGNGDGGRVPLQLASEGPRTLELLDLRNGVEVLLAGAIVPEGDYRELRLVVDEAEVTLAPGLTFEDGTSTRSLEVPSGMSSGIKVSLDEPLVTEDGQTTLVVVDFDVDRNFVFQGAPGTPAGLRGVTFTPRLHEKRRVTIEIP